MATDPKSEPNEPLDGDDRRPSLERSRFRAALRELLAEAPYDQLCQAELIAAAGVSAADFQRHYDGLDACFTELCQGFMREAAEETFSAYAAEDNWRDGMRAQIWASHRFLVADRLRARICVIDVNFGGDEVLAIGTSSWPPSPSSFISAASRSMRRLPSHASGPRHSPGRAGS